MKKLIAGIMTGIIITTTATAFASTEQTIKAIFGKVKLFVDGTPIQQETLLYNGTTYVPLRSAAEALGKNVNYDAETNSAYIGIMPSQANNKSLNCYSEVPWAYDIEKFVSSATLLEKTSATGGYDYMYYINDYSNKAEWDNYFLQFTKDGFRQELNGDILLLTKVENGIGYDVMLLPIDREHKLLISTYTYNPATNKAQDY